MKIGIPKETVAGERRVAATPETVKKLRSKGLEVLVARGAGEGACFGDAAYQEAGARLVEKEAALGADIVFKVASPLPEEIKALQRQGVLCALLNPCQNQDTLRDLAQTGISALAMELIPRISRAQSIDALSSQANIAGYRAVLEAANRYGRFFPMMMTAAGSARPARLVVLGAGVAGLQAIATARRLGCEVEAFDVRPEVKEQIESLGAKFIELQVGESGAGEGGYAKELSEAAKRRQQEALTAYLKKANVIVSTALIPCRPAPLLITEEAVRGMAEGSVIVDMAAAAGGNCALTRPDEVVTQGGVTIVGYTNYPSLVASDASSFYARNLFNLLSLMLEEKDGHLGYRDFLQEEVTRAALVTHDGKVLYQQ
jgi:NAD(P) transhydrogenase subunit alpha